MRPDGDPDDQNHDHELPPLDVVVPDDARELAAETAAYHRDRRRQRRRQRCQRGALRLLGPLPRLGGAAPILVGAFVLVLFSAALLMTFGPREATPERSAAPGEIGGPLPAGTVTALGERGGPRSSAQLRPGVLAIAPPGCDCADTIARLARLTGSAQVPFWLTADARGRGPSPEAARRELAAISPAASAPGAPLLVEDAAGLLAGSYAPAPGTPAPGLTIVLVDPSGTVIHVHRDLPGTPLPDETIRSLP